MSGLSLYRLTAITRQPLIIRFSLDIARRTNLRYTVYLALYGETMAKNPELTEQMAELAHLQHTKSIPTKIHRHQDSQDLLAARLLTGEHEAAVELVDSYYEQIYMFMRRLGHSRQVGEDLTQEIFMQAWLHIGQLRDGKALNSWLYRIASNASKLYWRKHKGRETASLEILNLTDVDIAGHHKAEYSEQVSRLKIAVEKLPWKLKQAIVLHYMQHLSIAKAAEAACIREGTFKSRLNRALGILRKHVSE
jgi:RNA polymerase sigma-70 factor (ECF subfamily)